MVSHNETLLQHADMFICFRKKFLSLGYIVDNAGLPKHFGCKMEMVVGGKLVHIFLGWKIREIKGDARFRFGCFFFSGAGKVVHLRSRLAPWLLHIKKRRELVFIRCGGLVALLLFGAVGTACVQNHVGGEVIIFRMVRCHRMAIVPPGQR